MNKPGIILIILMFILILMLMLMGTVDSHCKNKQIEQLQSSMSYLSGQCDSLRKQNEKLQRQLDQDFNLITKGWRD